MGPDAKRGTRIANHSYGLTPPSSLDAAGNPGVPNGLHLQTLYLDWAAVNQNILHVISGDENTWANASRQRANGVNGPLPRTDTLIIDAYNSLVVGATQQRAANGRFDEVSNWSNPKPSSRCTWVEDRRRRPRRGQLPVHAPPDERRRHGLHRAGAHCSTSSRPTTALTRSSPVRQTWGPASTPTCQRWSIARPPAHPRRWFL